jgi:uncharacterized protein YbaR (Trm112 family)
MRPDLLTWLRCSACAGRLAQIDSTTAAAAALQCSHCGRGVPVIDGIPRFVDEPKDAEGRRTQASFGYE